MRPFLALLITGVHVCAVITPSPEATALKTQLADLGVSFDSASATDSTRCPFGVHGENCLEVKQICCNTDGNVIGITLLSDSQTISSLSGVTLPASLLKLSLASMPNFVNLPTTLPGNLLELTVVSCPEFTGAGVTLPTSLTYLNWNANPKLNALPELPSSLTYLGISKSIVETLPALPASLLSLTIYESLISTLPALPASLTSLSAGRTNLMAVGALPSTLKELRVDYCPITELPALPSSLTSLNTLGSRLTAMPAYPAGVVWDFLKIREDGVDPFWHCPVANDEWVTESQTNGQNKILTTDLCVCPTGEFLPSDETSKSIVERACSGCQSSAGATCADASCGGSCDDGDDATYGDMCSGTTCAGTACQASSGATCADASCGGSCDDGDVATYNDMCSGTTCAGTACGTVANAANNASYTCTDGTDSRVSACASGFTKMEGAAGAADTCTNTDVDSAGQAVFAGLTIILSLTLM